MLPDCLPRLCIWTSFERVQTYHDNYVRELKTLADANETAERSVAFAFDGDIQDSGNCRPPSVASFSSGGSSFTTSEASSDSYVPLDMGHIYGPPPRPRSPELQSFGAAYDDGAAWPVSFAYTHTPCPPLQVPGLPLEFSFWDSQDPDMGIYRPGHASMALDGDVIPVGEVWEATPIKRPQRPSAELSPMRSSASQRLRAPQTTVDVAKSETYGAHMERTEEDIFNSFFEEMRRPMPAYHFVAP